MVRMVQLLWLSICALAQLDKTQHAHYIILKTHTMRFPILFLWIRTIWCLYTQHNRKQKGKVNVMYVCLCSHLFTARVTHSIISHNMAFLCCVARLLLLLLLISHYYVFLFGSCSLCTLFMQMVTFPLDNKLLCKLAKHTKLTKNNKQTDKRNGNACLL